MGQILSFEFDRVFNPKTVCFSRCKPALLVYILSIVYLISTIVSNVTLVTRCLSLYRRLYRPQGEICMGNRRNGDLKLLTNSLAGLDIAVRISAGVLTPCFDKINYNGIIISR